MVSNEPNANTNKLAKFIRGVIIDAVCLLLLGCVFVIYQAHQQQAKELATAAIQCASVAWQECLSTLHGGKNAAVSAQKSDSGSSTATPAERPLGMPKIAEFTPPPISHRGANSDRQKLDQSKSLKTKSHAEIALALPPASVPMAPSLSIPPLSFPNTDQVGTGIDKKTPAKAKLVSRMSKPVKFEKRKLNGVSFYQTTIDLKDPQCFIGIGLANDAPAANTQTVSYGDENFANLLKRHHAAVIANGTFFAKDDRKCVMGNMVSGGAFLKYSQWENFGTTLGIKAANVPEMITAREQGKPDWSQHWFSLTCGPRLVMDGDVWLDPDKEGFKDSHVLGIGPRAAIGYPASRDKLYLITFLNGLSLDAEARMMKAIGCYDAMNLDGGASKALARDGSIIVTPGRNLTNVIAIYDCKHPAPSALIKSWQNFQQNSVSHAASSWIQSAYAK